MSNGDCGCNQCKDVECYNKLYEFVRYIATDYFELSHEKVRVQRDDYVRMARKILKELKDEQR